jgi:hypothetical protein
VSAFAALQRQKLTHAGPTDVNRAAELKVLPRAGCGGLLTSAVISSHIRSELLR